MKPASCIRLLVRTIAVLFALSGIFWVCAVIILAFSYPLASASFIVRATIVATFITIPVMFVMGAILVIKEWSARSIQIFSLLFSLLVAVVVMDLTSAHHDALTTGDHAGSVMWGTVWLAVFVFGYLATKWLIMLYAQPEDPTQKAATAE